MFRLFIIFILALPIFSQGTDELVPEKFESSICFESYNECVSQCSPNIFHKIKYHLTTVKKKCEQSCKKGEVSCDAAPEFEKCIQFENNCQDNCSGRYYDWGEAQYNYVWFVKRNCTKSCTKGADLCELN